ncbi:hypothetical protein GCM10009850_092580 [Nonomuraea monospora]|uniref:Uncharacterized protein n=1 Tax=Nonomuraea monospora TaxID=568818 RepID=A0ABN3CX34_9ACTN
MLGMAAAKAAVSALPEVTRTSIGSAGSTVMAYRGPAASTLSGPPTDQREVTANNTPAASRQTAIRDRARFIAPPPQ